MKQQMRWLLATILTLLESHVTMAQHIVSDSIYIPPTMLPKATVFLPAPPDSVSPEFVDDLLQYQWGKSVRTTERGAQAYRESYNMAPSMCGIMAQVLKLDTISIEQTPALARLLIKSFVTGATSVLEAKWAHGRTRPFVMTNEAFQTLYETPVASVAAMPQSSGRSYRLDGTPATAQTRGIVIQDNRKTLKK